jgi:L-threonate 2-dehydrogenase
MTGVHPHAPPLHGSLPPEGAGPAWGGPASDLDLHTPPLRGRDVAVVGAGNMGGAMVARLCEAGRAVVVCDIDPLRQQQAADAGASLAETPALAAAALDDAGVLIVCVVDAAQSREVLFGAQGAAARLHAGQTVMLCPMSGGPARARDGGMSLMLAAPDALLARHDALLARLSSNRFVISERVGDGARTKLVNNLLAGINLVGAAEVLALADRMGLDMGATLDVIERSSGQSWIGSDRMRRAIEGDLVPRAHVTLLEKDTRLAVEAAQAAGFEGPLGARAAAVFAQAHAAGLAALDDSALLGLLRGRPGDTP